MNSLHQTYLVVDGTAAVLEDDLADGVGGGEEGVVGEAVGRENPVEVGHQGWDKLCPWKKWKWRWGKYSEKVKVKAETLERWDTKADVNSGESGDKFFLWKSESGENTRDVGP